jgi:hypothetical protein
MVENKELSALDEEDSATNISWVALRFEPVKTPSNGLPDQAEVLPTLGLAVPSYRGIAGASTAPLCKRFLDRHD